MHNLFFTGPSVPPGKNDVPSVPSESVGPLALGVLQVLEVLCIIEGPHLVYQSTVGEDAVLHQVPCSAPTLDQDQTRDSMAVAFPEDLDMRPISTS